MVEQYGSRVEIAPKRIVYKALNDNLAPYTRFKWPLPTKDKPGPWLWLNNPGLQILSLPKDPASSDIPPVLCKSGFHGYLTKEIAASLHPDSDIYEMEVAGKMTQDEEKLAASRARLIKLVRKGQEPVQVEEGVLNCKTCGKPHNSYITRKGFAPQWSDLTDGHSYDPESWETFVTRVTNSKTIAEAAAKLHKQYRHSGVTEYGRPYTSDPVVPAFHGPFEEWRGKDPEKNVNRCGTCGLPPELHDGWEERKAISEELGHLDRYELMIYIQQMRKIINKHLEDLHTL